MSKYCAVLLALLLCGCATGGSIERQKETYSSLEVTLIDMSKKITGYYARQGQKVPPSFDATEFFSVLDKVYPDKTKVEMMRTTFHIEAREVGGDYSVILCDKRNGKKLVEDLSCTLSRVDIRFWDKAVLPSCGFEADWEPYCK
jgi:hypothetical protein